MVQVHGHHNDYDEHLDQPTPTDAHGGQWMPTWAAAPQLTEPDNLPPSPFCDALACFRHSTIRSTLRVTSGSRFIRITVSNTFGKTDLPVRKVTVGLAAPDPEHHSLGGSRLVQTTTLRGATFSGQPSVVIPAGGHITSDAVKITVDAGQILSISIYLAEGQKGDCITSHPGSRTHSWISSGDCASQASMTAVGLESTSVAHWYYLSRVDAWQPASHQVLALIGDSLTDGRNSTDNANNRWPDLLFNRVQEDKRLSGRIAVVNQSIGGNRVLQHDVGPSLQSRLDRDVLTLSGLKYVLLFEGVNDIGTAKPEDVEHVGDCLIQAYRQILLRLRPHGIRVFGATLPPFDCADSELQPYALPERVTAWHKVNEWIRTSGEFDTVIDMAAVLSGSKDLFKLRPMYDSGDHLHPNLDGFQAMADAFPLDALDPPNDDNAPSPKQ